MGYKTLRVFTWLYVLGFFSLGFAKALIPTTQSFDYQNINKEPVYEQKFLPWDIVTALNWSEDGALIAVAAGNKVLVYNYPDWSLLGYSEIRGLTTSLSFDPSLRWLAASGKDGNIRIWKIEQFMNNTSQVIKPSKVIKAHRKGVNSLDFNRDGSILASSGNDAFVRLWDMQSDKMLKEFTGSAFVIPSISFHPQNNRLALITRKLIYIRNVLSGRILGSFRGEKSLYKVIFSHNGDFIAATDIDNLVLVWEANSAFQSGNETYPLPVTQYRHNGKRDHFTAIVWDVKFSPNDRLLASAGGDGSVQLWDFTTSKKVYEFYAHKGSVTCLSFSPDGKWLITGGLDAAIRLWKLDFPYE